MAVLDSIAVDSSDIEAYPRLSRRSETFWLALYPLAWVLLFSVSSIFWFLPAGLRFGVLWLLPRRAWWKMAIVEIGAIVALSLVRDVYDTLPGLLAGSALPWTLYALVVAAASGPGQAPVRRALPRLLGAGVLAATINALALTAIDRFDDGIVSAAVSSMFASYALGDFAGIVLMMPLVFAIHAQSGPDRRPLRTLLAHGFVFVPAGLALGISMLWSAQAPVYPLLYSLLPLFAIAYRFGWRPAAVAVALLSVGVHHVSDSLAQIWNPGELQLLMAMTSCAALLLGAAAETQNAQRDTLSAAVHALSSRTNQLTEAASRIASLQEMERRRIGAELHDQLGQDMTAIATRLRIVERTTADPAVRMGLASIGALVADAHMHLREAINHLHPTVLDRFGLARALAEGPLAELLRDHDVRYTCRIEGDVDALPDSIASAVYRICQEAITNCARHGCGGRVHLHLSFMQERAGSRLELRIRDEAGAIHLTGNGSGHGLQNIRDRAAAIGAEYHFDPEAGTPRHALSLRIPHPAAETAT